MKARYTVGVALACIVSSALAQGSRETVIVEAATAQASEAAAWGLTSEEWTRYKEIMRGPLGTWSPGLDPLTALGIEARSEAERTRIAELQARSEARRVEKLLTYQRAYDAAFQRLFPGLARVQPMQGTTPGTPEAGAAALSTRPALFVEANCPACDARARQLQRAGNSFDIYYIDTRPDDARLRQWAKTVGIDPAKVRARAITLNHDAGRWKALALPGGLPALIRKVDGTWQRQP
jgi:integrating conjugative element protein (TIGR03759 family)